ncbi:MAG: hypothetical protein ACRC62_17925 [Microcoleus sp.]
MKYNNRNLTLVQYVRYIWDLAIFDRPQETVFLTDKYRIFAESLPETRFLTFLNRGRNRVSDEKYRILRTVFARNPVSEIAAIG